MTVHLFFPSTSRLEVEGMRSWCFLSAKLALLLAIVYFASFDVIQVISRGQLQPQIAIIMYWVAFRWAMNDQRRRCPVCLRVLTNPVAIGHSAGTLLSWYGTELVCSKGHGVLHEPEPLARSYCMRRWVTLDASWQQLFR
jgi:hypothetical protein